MISTNAPAMNAVAKARLKDWSTVWPWAMYAS